MNIYFTFCFKSIRSTCPNVTVVGWLCKVWNDVLSVKRLKQSAHTFTQNRNLCLTNYLNMHIFGLYKETKKNSQLLTEKPAQPGI